MTCGRSDCRFQNELIQPAISLKKQPLPWSFLTFLVFCHCAQLGVRVLVGYHLSCEARGPPFCPFLPSLVLSQSSCSLLLLLAAAVSLLIFLAQEKKGSRKKTETAISHFQRLILNRSVMISRGSVCFLGCP